MKQLTGWQTCLSTVSSRIISCSLWHKIATHKYIILTFTLLLQLNLARFFLCGSIFCNLMSNNVVTLKTRLEVTQCHWKWHTIRCSAWKFVLAHSTNCDSILYSFRDKWDLGGRSQILYITLLWGPRRQKLEQTKNRIITLDHNVSREDFTKVQRTRLRDLAFKKTMYWSKIYFV